MPRLPLHDRRLLTAAIPLLLLSLFLCLGAYPAYLEEPRRAMVALEMLFRGDYIVPTQLGEYYYNKPPVFNWFILLFYRISGSFGEWVPRTLSILSLLAMGLMVFKISSRHMDRASAVLAGFLTVLCIDIFFYFSLTGEIDLFYSLISLASILAIFHFDRSNQTALLYTIPYLLAAIGSLTKGFPSPLFIGLTYFAWFGSQKDWRRLFHPAHVVGFVLYAAIVGAYFYGYSSRAELSPYLNGLLGQSTQRTMTDNSISDLLRHLWTFPLDGLKNMLPATLLLPFLFLKSVRTWIRNEPLLRFCLIALAANLVVYWISPGTRQRYVYMLYPLLIIPLAAAYSNHRQSMPVIEKSLRIMLGLLAVLLPFGIMSLPFLPSDELPGAWSSVPLALMAGLLSAALSWAIWRNCQAMSGLLMMLILGRIAFDLTVLPARAQQGEAPRWKSNALEIVDRSAGHELFTYGPKNAGNFSLAMGYYIERERKEVLGGSKESAPGRFFIAEPAQVDSSRVLVHFEYDWDGKAFWLFEFKD